MISRVAALGGEDAGGRDAAENTEKTVQTHLDNFLARLSAADDISYPGARALVSDVARYPEWRLGLATGSGRTRLALGTALRRIQGLHHGQGSGSSRKRPMIAAGSGSRLYPKV